METLIHAGLMNAFFAAILAVIVAGLAVLCRRRPAVVHGLWVLVLVKFLVPSVYPVEIPCWQPSSAQLDSPEPVVVQEIPARVILADQSPDPTEDLSPEPMISEPHGRAATERERTAKPLPIGRGSATAKILPPAAENLEPSTDPTFPTDSSAALAHLSWEKLVGIVWLTGSLAWIVVAGIRIVRFHGILRLAKPAHPEVQIRVRKLAERLGLSACPSVAFVSAPIAPLLWALTRSPRLLIPSQLWERLNEDQRDTLLAHELAHLRRGDHWVRRLEMVVLALYWWHPAVWWAQRQVREAEEQCCDAWVLWALPNAAQDYAVALIETLAFLSQSRPALPLGASGIEPIRLLKRRLSMIVQGHPPRGMSRLAFWAVVGLGLLLLPLLPIPAQQTGSPGSDDEEQVQRPAPPSTPAVSPKAPGLQPPPAEGRPIPADRAEQIEAARDQVDLMEAKLNIKRAELEETEMRIRLAQRNVKRLQELYEKGALPETALIKARDEAELLPTQLPTKKAELKEAEILLKQAQRRLRRLESAEAAPGGMGGSMRPAPAGAPGMMGPGGRPTMQSKGAPMKDPGGPPPGGMSGPGGSNGKALPGAAPAGGMPGKMGPSLPGPGGPMKAPPGSPAGPGTGKAPPAGSTLPPGPEGGPPANLPSDDAQGVVLNVDANTGLATMTTPGDPLRVGAGSRFEAYRLKPNPKYLGKIEILEVQDSIAVGRLLDGARFGSLEKGDLVASKIKIVDKPGGMASGNESNSTWADWLFEHKSWNFGTVRRGEELVHKFRLINALNKPVHITAVRSSAAFLTPRLVVVLEESGGAHASVREAWIGPHQSATIEVSMDTRRFVEDKTASVYVQFDQPSVAQVQLLVHARSVEVESVEVPAGTTLPGGTREPQESKARILELEIKVDKLMKQIDALRDELKQQPAKPRSGSSRSEEVPGTKIQRYIHEPDEATPGKP